ncbi:MAG: Txe/YoeB family addiction module toxin [Prevotellaceae bacterium]|jgi:toxin YoeB|nr:Txe/YoeB family addiction module toxin [Prevotellaceae bacterium]
MTYRLILLPDAEQDLEAHIKAGNKKQLKKIFALFEELKEHPQTGTGRPKLLRYQQAQVWSHRIDDKHRMVYTIENEAVMVHVIALWGHYDDK